MEQYISPELLVSTNSKQSQQHPQHLQSHQQATTNLDFLSFTSPSDILAPHPDLFESELDSSLAGFDPLQLQSLIIEQPDAFNFLRSDTPICGPPSTITVSSESAYETLSSYSESFYNQASSNYSFPFDLDMDFARASINAHSDYGSASAAHNTASGVPNDSLSDYSYEPSQQHSPPSTGLTNVSLEEYASHSSSPGSRSNGSVYSSYDSTSEYYPIGSSHPSLAYASVVSPTAISGRSQNAHMQQPQARAPSPVGAGLAMSLLPRISRNDSRSVPRLHPVSHMPVHASGSRQNESIDDPRKKYQCSRCTRAFARAYNLKTHMATHDPLRPKPFVCTHAGCGRSFSRKHDLGRHLVSIHRDETGITGSSYEEGSDSGSACGSEPRIGVTGMKEGINRCDACGKSGPKKCTCKHNVK